MRTYKFQVNNSFHNGEAIYLEGDKVELRFGEAVNLLRQFPDAFTPLDFQARYVEQIATGEVEPDEDEAHEIWFSSPARWDYDDNELPPT